MIDLHTPDSFLDYIRVVLFFISAFSGFVLVDRFRKEKDAWNTKTKDIWYGFVMWCITGCVMALQGIALDRPFTLGTVFLTAGILVTGKAVYQKGPWGGNAT